MLNELVLTAFVFFVIWVTKRLRRTQLPLPPGPKPWPIIGNALEIPTVRPWQTYRDWCRAHNSDVIHVHLPMQPVVVLGSAEAATDLLDKKSQIYSDRARSVVLEEMTWDFSFAVMPYNARWRAHRRMFHQHFNPDALDQYLPLQLQYAREFLSWTLELPENTPKNVRRLVTSVVFRVAYGKAISGMDDEFVLLAQKAGEGFILSTIPGAQWVELFPILKYIPTWVPGATVQKLIAEYRPSVVDAKERPYNEVKAAVANGTALPSVASTLIEHIRTTYNGTEEESHYDEIARNVAGVTYAAGADTTTTAAEVFLLAMAMFPEVQHKAQAELDRIVGPARLPDFSDIEKLTYVRAVAMETMRWIPVAPLGVPHRVTADDSYKGYHIPKGSIVFANIWAMLRDPEDYPEPELFKPERFIGADSQMDPSIRDPNTLAFGFGRRICPAKQFSNNTLIIYIASTLHVFDISAGVDKTGKPLPLSTEVTDGVVSAPRDVPCGLKPRSLAAEHLIREAALEHEA